jgi:superfamily II DNA or RNA helicase
MKEASMKTDQFLILNPNIIDNTSLREPQVQAFTALSAYDFTTAGGREVSVVLPVGCGKSGLLALAPFALRARRALLVAPNVGIADQLLRDLTPSNPKYFYVARNVLNGNSFPEPAEIRGSSSNRADLDEADIVVTNIQQLQRENNRWLSVLPSDYFDLIMFDEAHHNVADSWSALRQQFPAARILNVSATPTRADGRVMAGEVIYSYPISRAVEKGYVKRVNGYRLNPTTLHYVRREEEGEIEVSLDEVRRLGEQDAGFRRSIVSSEATLTTIAEASIRKLRQLRETTGEGRLKIIASALNMQHCQQVVAKYRELGLRADYVHSNESAAANERVHRALDNHDLDVIVQVRKLGEGFDHPYLSVAAVFSIFSNLGPFMQFVGRIMRVIPATDPFSAVNEGVVVFHVGANITGVWTDFQEFAEADQEFFAQLIDENIDDQTAASDGQSGGETGREPMPVITDQQDILLENLTLLTSDQEVTRALSVLQDAGIDTGAKFEQFQRITPTKQDTRRAKRSQLDDLVKNETGKILARNDLNNVGRDLDRTRENFVVIKSGIDRKIKQQVPSGAATRNDYTGGDLDFLIEALPEIAAQVEGEFCRG